MLTDEPSSLSYQLTTTDIPDDLLLHVFSFLDTVSLCKVRRVCHRWNRLSTDEILWKHKLLHDIKSWKQISHTTIPKTLDSSDNLEGFTLSNHDMYMQSCPDIMKLKRMFYQQTTLHQLTDFLKGFLPSKKYFIGFDAEAMDADRGQSLFSKLLAFDAANVFQHCGQFPGKFRGHGGGFLFKYKRHMLEICLMFVAPKSQRANMTLEEKLVHLELKLKDDGYTQLLAALDGYVHVLKTSVPEGSNESDVISSLETQAKELALLDSHLRPDTPLLVISSKLLETNKQVPSYLVAETLKLKQFTRPWMVSDCSSQMLYRDIVDPMDWLLSTAKPH